MFVKIWKNRIEFYPYLAIFIFLFFGSFANSLKVINRPGMTLLGVVTIPSVLLFIAAAVKTYKNLD